MSSVEERREGTAKRSISHDSNKRDRHQLDTRIHLCFSSRPLLLHSTSRRPRLLPLPSSTITQISPFPKPFILLLAFKSIPLPLHPLAHIR